MDIKDSYLHGAIGVVKSISVNADKLTYRLADQANTPVEVTLPTVTQSANGLAPKVITNTGTIGNTYYLLASSNGSSAPSWYKLPATAFSNDDTKVTLTNTTSNNTYRVLFSSTADDTTRTEGAGKSTNLKFNPSTGNLTTTSLNLNGDIVINDGTNKDRYIKWQYNNTDDYGWRIGYLGSKSADDKDLTFDSHRRTTGWASALYFKHTTLNAHFAGIVNAPTFQGNLDGTYVNKLTGYTKASDIAALDVEDSLNAALGKLEYKTDFIYNDLIGGKNNANVIDKWSEIKDFIAEVGNSTDITDVFVTRKTALTVTGLKTFESDSSTTGVSIILKNKGWTCNMSTAMDFYNGSDYKVPNARIETKMVGSGKNGGTLIFYTQTAHESTNPNPNGLTERFRLGDNGTSKLSGSFTVTSTITSTKFITKDGTSAQFVKGDGSLDSNTYALSSSLGNYVTLTTTQTIGGSKTFTSTLTTRSINPLSNNTYSLGTSDKKWSNLYSTNIYSNAIYNGTTIYASNNEIIHADSSYFELNKGYPNSIMWLNASEYKLNLGSKGVQFMIAANGNVGIGDVGGAPAYKLHVGGGEIMADTVHAWSGGFKKNGSSDSYVLLGGGGHKHITTFFTSLSSDSTNAISITIGGTTKSISKSTLASSLGSLKNPYSIKFKNIENTEVSYDGSSAVDLTGGLYYAKIAGLLNSTTLITNTKFTSLTNASWTDTGYTFTELESGTYAIQVTSTNLVASGIMSILKNIEDTKGDEIPLHVYGTDTWRPYLRTHKNKLEISSNDVTATSRTVTIKIARII